MNSFYLNSDNLDIWSGFEFHIFGFVSEFQISGSGSEFRGRNFWDSDIEFLLDPDVAISILLPFSNRFTFKHYFYSRWFLLILLIVIDTFFSFISRIHSTIHSAISLSVVSIIPISFCLFFVIRVHFSSFFFFFGIFS